jgi:hypothetical protein
MRLPSANNGVGFRVQTFGFRIQGFGFRFYGVRFRTRGAEFQASGLLHLPILVHVPTTGKGSESKVSGVGFGVYVVTNSRYGDSGFRFSGLGLLHLPLFVLRLRSPRPKDASNEQMVPSFELFFLVLRQHGGVGGFGFTVAPRSQEASPPPRNTLGPQAEAYCRVIGGGILL